ncbi:MAG: hypothetical protein PVG66_06430 [Chromatiales bacterium]|jgi:hypothetical protein
MAEIADIKDSEMWIIKTALKQRYGKDMENQIADAEIRLSPSDRELGSCPMALREADDCHFVAAKASASAFATAISNTAPAYTSTTTSTNVRSGCYRPRPITSPRNAAM